MVLLAVEGLCAPALAVGCRGTRRDKAYVRRHHQQAVHEPEGTARLVPPTLGAKHVPDAGDGVDPEQPDNAGADYGMRALLRIGVAGPVVERLTQCELDPEEGQRREACVLVDLAARFKGPTVFDRRRMQGLNIGRLENRRRERQ